MSRVFWDTDIFIHLLEGHGALFEQVTTLRRAMLVRGDQLFTSALTLGEVLVKPLERGETALAGTYQRVITSSCVMIDFDVRAAKRFASLRCDRTLRAPDAIQLACASVAGVDLFLTQDARLHGKQIGGIQFIVPVER